MSDILYSTKGAVAFIAFNRPKANGYDLAFHQTFFEAIIQAEADPGVRVVIIRSALERFFCAGADIKAFAENSVEDNQEMVDFARKNLALIEASDKIYIAEINGHALGGGLEIVMACDLRFGGDGSYLLGLPEVKLGLIPGNGGSQRISRIVGISKAFELCVTGDSIGPQEAHRIGLLNRIFPSAELEQETASFAATLSEGAPLAMTALKKSMLKGAEMTLKDSLNLEASMVDELYDTEDAAEGFKAFTEKRDPVYKGR